MKRRDFLKAILAAGVAPAVVRSESIMRINPVIWTPEWVNVDGMSITQYLTQYDDFMDASRLLFYQAAAPTGWRKIENLAEHRGSFIG